MNKFKFWSIILIGMIVAACNNGKEKVSENTSDSIQNINDSLSTETAEIADTATYVWNDEFCTLTGKYLPSKYSKKQIEQTFQLCQAASNILDSSSSVFDIEDIENIDFEPLKKSYKERMAFFDNCTPVDVPFWKTLIIEQKKRITKEYNLEILRMKAYTNPKVLLDDEYSKMDKCKKYAIALNSDDETLKQVWKEYVHKYHGQNNIYMEKFKNYYIADNWKDYARIDLITFAWWSCVNESIHYADNGLLQEEFKKLFVSISMECDEP